MRYLILIALFATVAFGQSSYETKMLKLPKEKTYFTEYDKFKDISTVRSPNFTVNDLKGKLKLGTGIMLVLRYAGKQPNAESQHHLVISGASADGRQFDRTIGVIALLDGTRFDLSVTDTDSKVKESKGLGILFGSPIYVEEKLLIPLSPKAVAAFRTAKSIEIQADRNEFALHNVAVTIFRNILELAPQN